MSKVRMNGIDVSYWQGKPSASSYKAFKAAGWDFIVARIGFADGGVKGADSTFDHNYKYTKKYGLKTGAYFYSNARNGAEGRAEAKYVIQLLKGRKLDMPVWIDMEDNATSGKASKTNLAAACKGFCGEMEKAGYLAGVYASTSWLQAKIGNLGTLPVWVAQYNDQVTWSGNYDIWQYSSTRTVPGFTGRRDVNYCYVTYDGKTEVEKPRKSYTGTFPKLPSRGYFRKGDKGTQTKHLQKLLSWAINARLKVDGIIGEKTVNAVYQFQEDYGLIEDGLFGAECLAKAKSICK